jgi:hypothetical protein
LVKEISPVTSLDVQEYPDVRMERIARQSLLYKNSEDLWGKEVAKSFYLVAKGLGD